MDEQTAPGQLPGRQITFNHSVSGAVESPSFERLQAEQEARVEQMRQAERSDLERAARPLGPAVEQAITAPERIKSLELQLPNGRVVEMSAPSESCAFVIANLLGEKLNDMALAYAKSFMYVSKIDGQSVVRPTSQHDLQEMANRFGDDGTDIVLNAYGTYWPPVSPAALPVIKKNLR